MVWLGGGLLLILALYTVLPEGLCHVLGVGVRRRGDPARRRVALTFDDGPDPAVTPQVLQTLSTAGVRATFFLVGRAAESAPEVVREIHHLGHEIGNHTLRHRPAWLMSPWATTREIAETSAIIRQITGHPPRWGRPPWGLHNAWTRRSFLQSGIPEVLWSLAPGDWWRRVSAGEIARRVVEKARAGDVILLHDGGTSGAGPKTAAALPAMIRGLREKGLEPVPLSELLDGGRPSLGMRLLRRLWGYWEAAFERLEHLDPVGDPRQGLFRLGRVEHYHGPVDGLLQRGMTVGEIHFRNRLLLELGLEGKTGVRTRSLVLRALPDLAQAAASHPRYKDVSLFFGVTLIHRGAERLGLEVFDLPDDRYTWRMGAYLRFLMALYHPEGFHRLRRHRQALIPKLVYITREELLRRYLPSSPTAVKKG